MLLLQPAYLLLGRLAAVKRRIDSCRKPCSCQSKLHGTATSLQHPHGLMSLTICQKVHPKCHSLQLASLCRLDPLLSSLPADERLAHALQQAEIRTAGHAMRPASGDRAPGSGASNRGYTQPPVGQPSHTMPGRDAGGPGAAPSAPRAPAPHGWDPFTFDSTPTQHTPAGRQQVTTTWSQQPAPQTRRQQPATTPSWQQPQHSPPAARAPPPAARPHTADDEALARALQGSQTDHSPYQRSNPTATAAPHRTAPHTADDEAFARALQASLNSHSQGDAHPSQPGATAPRPDHSSPLPSQPQQRVSQQPGSQNACAGCERTLPGFWSLGQTIEAAGKRYHADCFVCGGCNGPLGTGVYVHGQDGRLYHRSCHRARFHPRCAVCTDFLPEQV